MIGFLLSPLGKAVGIVAVAAALFLAWQADRAWQRAAGAKEVRAEYERIIEQSKVLTNAEKDATLDAASAAAARVCHDAGLPADACEGL